MVVMWGQGVFRWGQGVIRGSAQGFTLGTVIVAVAVCSWRGYVNQGVLLSICMVLRCGWSWGMLGMGGVKGYLGGGG